MHPAREPLCCRVIPLCRRASPSVLQVVIFFQNLALLNSFVSIMLPFSVTSVKALHTWFAEQSLAVYHEETDTRMAVRSATHLLPHLLPSYSPPAAILLPSCCHPTAILLPLLPSYTTAALTLTLTRCGR